MYINMVLFYIRMCTYRYPLYYFIFAGALFAVFNVHIVSMLTLLDQYLDMIISSLMYNE